MVFLSDAQAGRGRFSDAAEPFGGRLKQLQLNSIALTMHSIKCKVNLSVNFLSFSVEFNGRGLQHLSFSTTSVFYSFYPIKNTLLTRATHQVT